MQLSHSARKWVSRLSDICFCLFGCRFSLRLLIITQILEFTQIKPQKQNESANKTRAVIRKNALSRTTASLCNLFVHKLNNCPQNFSSAITESAHFFSRQAAYPIGFFGKSPAVDSCEPLGDFHHGYKN